MKLLYAPGACSLGIHVLLEEIGNPYEAEAVDLRTGAHLKPEYTAINPKSKVPALVRDDGSVLTEFPAIAYWLARTNPDAHLLPDDVDGQARALETTDYLVGTVHGHGFARMFLPHKFSDDHAKAKARGREIIDQGLALTDTALEGKDYVCGSAFSIADAALFYIESWAGVLSIKLPPNCAAHYQRMLARPAVARAMHAEGLSGR